MKKILIAILAISMLSGCGRFDRWFAKTTGRPANVCVDGVNYLQFTSGATVQVDGSGKPVPCK